MLASGSGTILEAIITAGVGVAAVFVDRPCRAVDVALSAAIPALRIERSSYGRDFDRLGYTKDVVAALEAHDIDLVAMAGFGTILAEPIFDTYRGRILNTHPSLLPAFRGWHAVSDALDAGVKVTGCTVHIATVEVDQGPILC